MKTKTHKITETEKSIQRKSWVKGEMLLAFPNMTEDKFEKIWSIVNNE